MSCNIISEGETRKGENIKKTKSAVREHTSTSGAPNSVAKESRDKRYENKCSACPVIKCRKTPTNSSLGINIRQVVKE